MESFNANLTDLKWQLESRLQLKLTEWSIVINDHRSSLWHCPSCLPPDSLYLNPLYFLMMSQQKSIIRTQWDNGFYLDPSRLGKMKCFSYEKYISVCVCSFICISLQSSVNELKATAEVNLDSNTLRTHTHTHSHTRRIPSTDTWWHAPLIGEPIQFLPPLCGGLGWRPCITLACHQLEALYPIKKFKLQASTSQLWATPHRSEFQNFSICYKYWRGGGVDLTPVHRIWFLPY